MDREYFLEALKTIEKEYNNTISVKLIKEYCMENGMNEIAALELSRNLFHTIFLKKCLIKVLEFYKKKFHIVEVIKDNKIISIY